MRKHISKEDDELGQVARELEATHQDHRLRMARGEVVPLDELRQVFELSQRHSELMTAPRVFECAVCGKATPKEKANFLIVREAIIYDEAIPGPRLVTLPQEIYLNITCPECVTDEVRSHLGLEGEK